jgi:hypothetical protein
VGRGLFRVAFTWVEASWGNALRSVPCDDRGGWRGGCARGALAKHTILLIIPPARPSVAARASCSEQGKSFVSSLAGGFVHR